MLERCIMEPNITTSDLQRLALLKYGRLAPGRRVMIYTVHRWSPVSIMAAITPMAVHHALKGLVWEAQERDTFPVEYRMNTRKDLARLFARFGFEEKSYRLLSDCPTFQ